MTIISTIDTCEFKRLAVYERRTVIKGVVIYFNLKNKTYTRRGKVTRLSKARVDLLKKCGYHLTFNMYNSLSDLWANKVILEVEAPYLSDTPLRYVPGTRYLLGPNDAVLDFQQRLCGEGEAAGGRLERSITLSSPKGKAKLQTTKSRYLGPTYEGYDLRTLKRMRKDYIKALKAK